MLALLDLCEQGHATLTPNPKKPLRVVAVNIDIRAHNLKAMEEHPLWEQGWGAFAGWGFGDRRYGPR